MSNPVNLNRARKDKARANSKARADANAVKFGRTKAQKRSEEAADDKAVRHLDAHKRET